MSQSPDNLDPNATPSRDDSQLDAFVDGQLHGEQRTAFEARIEREAALGEAHRCQRAIDASLRRLFPQPTIAGQADRVLERAMAQLPPETVPAEHNGHATLERAAAAASIALRDRAHPSEKRRREPLLRGWLAIAAMITLLVNQQRYEALPQLYRDALEAACAEQNVMMMAKYDAKNPEALRRLVAAGVQLRQFPRPVLDACYKATFETYDELAAKNDDFKKIYASWQKFLADSNLWFRLAENNLDNYRYIMSAQR